MGEEARSRSRGYVMTLLPPILFTTAYGAGLATGPLHFGAPGWVAAISLLVGLLTRRSLAPVLCAAVVFGRLSGEIAWIQEERSCSARLPAGRLRLSVRVLEPAERDGGRVAVQPLG